MTIVIDNLRFPYDIGCKILKTKYKDNCPTWFNQPEIWDEILPISLKEITSKIETKNQKRLALSYFGVENMLKEINPKLLCSETITKTTTYINSDAELVQKTYEDTYELYEVAPEILGLDNFPYHFVQCKDTSTGKKHIIWVACYGVWQTNNEDVMNNWSEEEWANRWENKNYGNDINPIQAIAWTIKTDLHPSSIEEIVRQGDCILIKHIEHPIYAESVRHLTEEEYRKFLVLES